MSRAATTVNVVTTDGPAGRAGVTVSAMASVSADTERPTLLVCLYHKVSAVDPIRENGTFCVNVLREDQARISDAFAGRVPDLASRFDAGTWHDTSLGVPRLDGAICSFVCRIDAAQLCRHPLRRLRRSGGGGAGRPRQAAGARQPRLRRAAGAGRPLTRRTAPD